MPITRATLENMTSDQLVAFGEQAGRSHELVQTLLANPATREAAQRLVKQAIPTTQLPELDLADKMRAELEAERKERLKLEQDLRTDQITRRAEALRAQAAARYGLTDADMVEVEKLMTAEHDAIPTYDAAARVYNASRQPSTPTPASFRPPTTYEMPEKDVWAPGIGNKARLDKIAMGEAWSAWEDIRTGKVKGLGPAIATS